MKAKVLAIVLTCFLFNSAYSGDGTGVLNPPKVINPPPSEEPSYEELRQQFTALKILYAEIDKTIARIDVLHKGIEDILNNKDDFVTCELKSKLKREIKKKKQELGKSTDENEKTISGALKNYEEAYNDLVKKSRSIQCR